MSAPRRGTMLCRRLAPWGCAGNESAGEEGIDIGDGGGAAAKSAKSIIEHVSSLGKAVLRL